MSLKYCLTAILIMALVAGTSVALILAYFKRGLVIVALAAILAVYIVQLI